MQKLDRATLLEMAWRDFLLWPLVRPLGVVFYVVITPFVYALVGGINRVLSLFVSDSSQGRHLDYHTAQREIFTFANAVSGYGLFLFGELLYVIWGLYAGHQSVQIYSFSSWFWDIHAPSVYLIALLAVEIFATDLIDGPSARVNDQVTALGTLLDHLRDYLTLVTLFGFLIALAMQIKSPTILILLAAAFGGLLFVLAYHVRLMRLFAKETRVRERHSFGDWFKWQITRVRAYALNEYQTKLTGRIQFGALACGVALGLFYFATENATVYILFVVALVVSLMATSYYLYELWGEYYEKMQQKVHTASQHLKEKLVDRVLEIKEK